RLDPADLGALGLCYCWQSGPPRRRESSLCEVIARRFQLDRAEAGRDRSHRSYGRDDLPDLGVATLCRPRRARLDLSSSPAASADSFERTNRTHAPWSDGARNVAREWHSPCFSLWGKSALHDVPDPGDKRAAQSARTIGIGGEGAGPYRSDVRRAAGLSDSS